MGQTFYAFKIYFDELGRGVSAGISFNEGIAPFDSIYNRKIRGTTTFTITKCKYIAREIGLVLRIKVHPNLKESYSKYVDLMQLVPLKYHDSVVLQQFLEEAGLVIGTAISDINDLEKLIDKYNISEDYLEYLADLIGLKIMAVDEQTLRNKRKQLVQAIDWYKRKGTYKSFQDISYALNITLSFSDMYTNDYATFVRVPWFVGNEGENPSGLDVSYYKSPHFGIDLTLDIVYGTGVTSYLFIESMYTDLLEQMEQIRPINVVYHYSVYLTADTNELGDVVTSAGNVAACVNGDWVFTAKYCDDGNFADDSLFFDFREDSFISTITKWKMGIGHINTPPVTGDTALGSSVLSGTIDTQTVYDDRVEFDIIVPAATTQDGITELGLFLGDGTTMVAEATFPSIQKIEDVELRVKFIIRI